MIRDKDPSNWPSSRRYVYSKGTSTSSLRPHIEKYHLDKYKKIAKEGCWKILLPGLVSQSRSEAMAATIQEGQPDKFDEHTFHKHLLNFIVADDQVIILIWFLCLGVIPHTHPECFVFSVLECCRML